MASGLPPKVGPFEPVELLAVGGMARVVLARRSGIAGFEQEVALKLILPELADDEEYTTMFLDEAHINSRVQHPNVVSILDVGRDEPTQILFMAMELVLGATLAQLQAAHRKGISVHVALEIIAQAADGLAAAHRATTRGGEPLEIVHRDVSPQNLLVGLDGLVRISDFGVAHAANRLTQTRTGQFKGKLAYCSPEQALGRRVDSRSDLFALGLVAFELLTQLRLFRSDTPFGSVDRILNETIPPIRSLRDEVPPEAAGIIHAMLCRDPADRPEHAEEIADGLRACANQHGFPPPGPDLKAYVAEASSGRVLELAGFGRRAVRKSDSKILVARQDFEPTRVDSRPTREDAGKTIVNERPDE